MEAQVIYNSDTCLYDLVIKINNQPEKISTSKNYGHWQYHLNRGTLSKSIARYGITEFVYLGFTPDTPRTSPLPLHPAPPIAKVASCTLSWFVTQPIIEDTKKQRGRPRKYFPQQDGVKVHKVSDNEQLHFRMLSMTEKNDIERTFKQFKKTMCIREALDEICLKFNLTYKHAYEALKELI